jgi:hypothetical protein
MFVFMSCDAVLTLQTGPTRQKRVDMERISLTRFVAMLSSKQTHAPCTRTCRILSLPRIFGLRIFSMRLVTTAEIPSFVRRSRANQPRTLVA